MQVNDSCSLQHLFALIFAHSFFIECQDGRYGLNCESDCNCKIDQEVCNKSSGFCKSGCKLGYAGESCMIRKCISALCLFLLSLLFLHISVKFYLPLFKGSSCSPSRLGSSYLKIGFIPCLNCSSGSA